MTSIVIAGAQRTAIGSFQGQFAGHSAPQLGAAAIAGSMRVSALPHDAVDEVIMGCVLPAGVGQAPARQAMLGAGLPQSARATTVNKVCGSGMKAVMLAYDQIRAESASVVVAGGMESMTNAPYFLPKARAGLRLGHGQVIDHMFYDGLQSPYDGELMGVFAERCAERFQFTRAEQDKFAERSVLRAQAAVSGGGFKSEIAAVPSAKEGGEFLAQDETPGKCDISKLPKLKPAFKKDGTVTPANSSSISDGAASMAVMREADAGKHGVEHMARIVGHATFAREPEWFTIAPIGAISRLLEKTGWTKNDVDLYEINEAFAVVTMAAMRELGLPHEKVNVNGGACALGHPIGATGARIIVTLLHALKSRGLKKGIASLCLGGGEATAIAVEMIA
ncbi:MAG: acetyl-CoA C-acyltransferase [Aestuariivirga sp.]